MRHELSKARQFAKVRAGRTSRLAAWMSSQENLSSTTSSGDAPDHDEEQSISPVEICRPLSSKKAQFIIFQSQCQNLKTFHAGMVMSVFRGGAVKNKATSRRMSVSKPLATASPANVMSKLRVVVLQSLDDTTMVVSPLADCWLIDVEDICGEIVACEEGTKNGKMFVSFSEKSMGTFKALQNGEILFGKTQKQAKKAQEAGDNDSFSGFTWKSFQRTDAGEKNIERLGLSKLWSAVCKSYSVLCYARLMM